MGFGSCIFVSCSNHVAETPPATAPASSPPPSPAQASAISTDLSQKLQEHLQSGALLRDKPARHNRRKGAKGHRYLETCEWISEYLHKATPANSPDNAMASQALIEGNQVTGYLFAEVGSDIPPMETCTRRVRCTGSSCAPSWVQPIRHSDNMRSHAYCMWTMHCDARSAKAGESGRTCLGRKTLEVRE